MSTRGRDGGAGSSSDEQSRMLFPPQPGEAGYGRDADAVDLVSDEEDAEVAAAAAAAAASASSSSSAAASSAPPPPLAVGDQVWAKWTNGGWFSGTLAAHNADGTWKVDFDDGEPGKARLRIRQVVRRPEPRTDHEWAGRAIKRRPFSKGA